MSTADKSGPAFPNWSDNYYTEQRPGGGMTLRDYFAAKAMQEAMSWDDDACPLTVAATAYQYADAMLRARAL